MIKNIKASDRHFNDIDWLKTYWLFSFSNYYDPENMNHGKLRVFNDDIIEPDTGFGTHPHEEMEIVTIILNGEISHKDSMGNKGKVIAGDVQRMSAGTGLTHSEHNLGTEPLELYQIWLYPRVKGVPPSYEQKQYSVESYRNCLFPVASGEDKQDAVSMNSDATIYRGVLDKGETIPYETNKDRKIFVYVTSGSVKINGELLQEKDQARIELEDTLEFFAKEKCDLIVIDTTS